MYIQYYLCSERHDDTDNSIVGIAELWFESEEAQQQAYQSEEYKAVVSDY